MLLLSARAIVLLPCLIVPACAQDNPSEFFEKRVRPILATKCYSCHTTSPPAGLRLDSRAGMLAGGKSGPAIVPGKPAESLLIRVVSNPDAKLRMPQAVGKLIQQEEA